MTNDYVQCTGHHQRRNRWNENADEISKTKTMVSKSKSVKRECRRNLKRQKLWSQRRNRWNIPDFISEMRYVSPMELVSWNKSHYYWSNVRIYNILISSLNHHNTINKMFWWNKEISMLNFISRFESFVLMFLKSYRVMFFVQPELYLLVLASNCLIHK